MKTQGETPSAYDADRTPQTFHSISEVAGILQVPQHVLRFWESKFSQLKPVKRRGGRRYYRITDIELLCGVHKLLYGDRYTIEGVQKVLSQRGIRFVAGIGRDILSRSGAAIAMNQADTETQQQDAEETERAGEGGATEPEPEAEPQETPPQHESESPAESQPPRQPNLPHPPETRPEYTPAERKRLLSALDMLEEIGAAMLAEPAASDPADSASESDEPNAPKASKPARRRA